MKYTYWTTILLAGALLIVSILYADTLNRNESSGLDSTPDSSQAIDYIISRSSVRKYSHREIPDSDVTKILKAGMSAPTAADCRPWKFFVIRDKELKLKLSESGKYSDMAKNANVVIVACGDLNRALPGESRDYWVQDVSAATENMLVAANMLGIGSVWTGVYPIKVRIDKIREILLLPDNFIPLSMICFGYPQTPPVAKDKWNPENVFYGKYN